MGSPVKARVRHRVNLVGHLSDPANDWPRRKEFPRILGISKKVLYKHFTPDDLTDIENEGLELRRKRMAWAFGRVDKALIDKAVSGDVQAIKLMYQRFENWSEKTGVEVTGKDGGPIDFRNKSDEQLKEELTCILASLKLGDREQ